MSAAGAAGRGRTHVHGRRRRRRIRIPGAARLWTLGGVLAVAIAAIVLYSGTLSAPFLYDDLLYVVDNPSVRDLSRPFQVWVSPYSPNLPEFGVYRPTTSMSYMLDFALSGMDAASFHRTNLVLYALASVLLFAMLRSLGNGRAAATSGALLFAVHAVHTEAVSWVVGRAEVLAGLLCFAAVLCWARYRRTGGPGYLAATAAAYFLGLGAKEIAAPLPAVLALGEWLGLFGSDHRARPAEFRVRWARLPWGGIFAVASAFAVYVALRLHALSGRFGAGATVQIFAHDPDSTRWATALAGIGRYVRLTLLPVDLRVVYTDRKIDTFWNVEVGLGIGIAVALFLLARRAGRRLPLVAFGIGWFALFLLPVSNLPIEIGAVMAERFLFLPSAGACIAAGAAFAWARRRERRETARRAALAALILVVAGFSVLTTRRNADWQDAERFWRTVAEQSPASRKSWIGLGSVLWDLGRLRGDPGLLDESDAALRSGLAIRSAPGQPISRDRLLLLHLLADHLQQRGRAAASLPYWGELHPHLDAFPRALSSKDTTLMKYGAALQASGRSDEARGVFREVLDLADSSHRSGALLNLSLILHQEGDTNGALERAREAIAEQPRLAPAHLHLATLYLELGRPAEASGALDEALELWPTDAASIRREDALLLYRSAKGMRERGRLEDALRLFAPLAAHLPHLPGFYFPGGAPGVLIDYGLALEEAGRPDEARAIFERATTEGTARERAGALSNLGNLLRENGDLEGALERYRAALELWPEFATAHANRGLALMELGRPDDAFVAFGRARRLGMDEIEALARRLAQADLDRALAAEDDRAAYRVLERLATAVEETAQDAFLKGVLAARSGDLETAERHYRRALAIDPAHDGARDELSRLGAAP